MIHPEKGYRFANGDLSLTGTNAGIAGKKAAIFFIYPMLASK